MANLRPQLPLVLCGMPSKHGFWGSLFAAGIKFGGLSAGTQTLRFRVWGLQFKPSTLNFVDFGPEP